jgi:hypothetical protein
MQVYFLLCYPLAQASDVTTENDRMGSKSDGLENIYISFKQLREGMP